MQPHVPSWVGGEVTIEHVGDRKPYRIWLAGVDAIGIYHDPHGWDEPGKHGYRFIPWHRIAAIQPHHDHDYAH